MQGVLSKVNLVPGDLSHLNQTKASNTSQQISLTGFTCGLFTEGVNQLKELHTLYDRYFQGNAMTKWTPQEDHGCITLNASSRFFTSLLDEPDAVPVPFGYGVDPNGHLQKFVGNHLIHTEDNIVSYFQRVKNESTGAYEMDVAFPSTFRTGDIVEIEASVIMFKTKQDQYKMHCNLRLLTLLDGTYSKLAEKAKRDSIAAATIIPKVKLRRKSGYADEGPSKKHRGDETRPSEDPQ
ncbi:hypothetical protein DFH07DRAFT_971363 [Mycena maculata]|uniref:Uncharacterized protein n=1 Tax=Mycena maculata TaxID=230809 RepID=A0AAD7HM98_9AGAR|nr:hypothetical protein DFH07DRAFT_971363 [Mycena maculata]